MLCPACKTELKMSERSGIEIDYCPSCRGVWLDRGELDKILERNASSPPAASPSPVPTHHSAPVQQGGYHQPYPKRRKSFLEELFD